MRALLVVLLLSAALAGCTSQPAAPPATAPPAPGPGAPDAAPAGNGSAPPEPAAPREVVLYLTPDRALAEAAPSAGTVAESFGFFSVGFTTGQEQPVPWAMASPLREGWRITAMSFDLWFSAAHPHVATSTPVGFEPVSVWFGSAPAWSPNNQFDAPDSLAPGDVVHAGGPMQVPPGGFVVEAGMVPAMYLLLGYDQSAAAPIQVHVGGEEASRFTLTVEPFALPPGLIGAEEAHEGAFTLNTFIVPHPDPAQQLQAFPVGVAPGMVKIEALLEGGAAAGNQDLDLVLFDPSGRQVWASSTPLAAEGVRLYPPTLAPGDYTLEVQNFQSVQGTFRLTVRTFAAAGNATAPVAA